MKYMDFKSHIILPFYGFKIYSQTNNSNFPVNKLQHTYTCVYISFEMHRNMPYTQMPISCVSSEKIIFQIRLHYHPRIVYIVRHIFYVHWVRYHYIPWFNSYTLKLYHLHWDMLIIFPASVTLHWHIWHVCKVNRRELIVWPHQIKAQKVCKFIGCTICGTRRKGWTAESIDRTTFITMEFKHKHTYSQLS